MACACKNKMNKIEKIVNGKLENAQPLEKMTALLFSFVGRILAVFLIIIFLPLLLVFLIVRTLFYPDKEMIINVDKFVKRWKKITE